MHEILTDGVWGDAQLHAQFVAHLFGVCIKVLVAPANDAGACFYDCIVHLFNCHGGNQKVCFYSPISTTHMHVILLFLLQVLFLCLLLCSMFLVSSICFLLRVPSLRFLLLCLLHRILCSFVLCSLFLCASCSFLLLYASSFYMLFVARSLFLLYAWFFYTFVPASLIDLTHQACGNEQAD
jgi:hypothetical protein